MLGIVSNGISPSIILGCSTPKPACGTTEHIAHIALVHAPAMMNEEVKTHEDYASIGDGMDGVVRADTIKIVKSCLRSGCVVEDRAKK